MSEMKNAQDEIKGMVQSMGFPAGSDGKESACNSGDPGWIPGLGRFHWRRKWQPTPVFLSGEFPGQRSLVGSSPGVAKSQTQLPFISLGGRVYLQVMKG